MLVSQILAVPARAAQASRLGQCQPEHRPGESEVLFHRHCCRGTCIVTVRGLISYFGGGGWGMLEGHALL